MVLWPPKRKPIAIALRGGRRCLAFLPTSLAMAKAIAFATAQRCHPVQPGAKAPGQRPPRHRRALLARRVGRWPALYEVRRSLPHRSAGAGETQCVSCPRPERGRKVAPCLAPRRHGKGHRLCHAATSPPASRGPKPPASARPAHGGRFSPAGTGAGLCCARTCRSTGHCPARAGKRSAFPVPARRGGGRWCHAFPLPPPPWQRPSPLPRRNVASRQPGAKAPGQRPPRPRRALLARRVGRWPALRWVRRSLPRCSAGAGKRSAFPVPAQRRGGRWPHAFPPPHGKGHRL
jgi:hypothetical protein